MEVYIIILEACWIVLKALNHVGSILNHFGGIMLSVFKGTGWQEMEQCAYTVRPTEIRLRCKMPGIGSY